MRILITGACGVTSRAVARSLRLSAKFPELHLIGTDICDNPYGLFEGLYDKIYRLSHVNEPGYQASMENLCKAERIDAAIVIPELEVLYWSTAGFPVPALLPPPGFSRIAVSKRRLYETLEGRNLVPHYAIRSREELLRDGATPEIVPCWIRDFSEGNSSGKGALLASTSDEIRAWVLLNRGIAHFMLSEVLPGRNFACHLLYDRGRVVKVASYERLAYFMTRTAPSGVTGNISKGRLVNDDRLAHAAEAAVAAILEETGEVMSGLIAVDFRESMDEAPMITEINLRHVAATYSFAAAGFNLAEAHLLLTVGNTAELGDREAQYPPQNMIFRDIDGTPIWVADYRVLAVGESLAKRQPSKWSFNPTSP